MRDIVYVDIEATSLIDAHLPGGRRVWDVAVIRDTGDLRGPLCAWLQITDVDLTHADPVSLDIGRFADRFRPDVYGPVGPEAHLEGRGRPVMWWGTTEAHAAATLDELTGGDAVIAGSNPRFDMDSLADLLRRHGREPSWYHHPRDVPNFAQGWLAAHARVAVMIDQDRMPAFPPGARANGRQWTGSSYPTGDLSEGCGVPVPADRHSAWADAAWCYRWDRVLRGLDTPPASAGTRPNGPAPVTIPV